MKESYGIMPNGQETFLYSITYGNITAKISDYGATLVSLYVPDAKGNVADVVLAWADCNACVSGGGYIGATVGRNANRIGGASFMLGDKKVELPKNERNANNLHSGPDSYAYRLWQVANWEKDSITFSLHSPDGDQGFPGNADITVTYRLEYPGTLRIIYDAVSDKDTVFNLTNHSYFNLAGHDKPELAMDMELMMPARFYTVADAASIPTGENRDVAGTPMDFREPKPIGRDINEDYEALNLQGGYDHNFEVFCQPAAVVHDPHSGRTMVVTTDLPGVQFYAGNYLSGKIGKEGVAYTKRGGIALETQYYPDSVNHPNWPQPFVKAGQRYHTETCYTFK